MVDVVRKQMKHFEMYLRKDDPGISKALMSSENREPAFTYLMRENVKPGDICMDIGANIGYVSLLLGHMVGKEGRVYLVEPDHENYKVLLRNIGLNNSMTIFEMDNIAIGDKYVRDAKFYPSAKSNLGSLFEGKNTGEDWYLIESESLDNYLMGRSLPSFYKMDVEGAEVLVLNGMHEVAKSSKVGTKILMEIHPREYGPELDMRQALVDMFRLGFAPTYLISAGLARPKIFRDKGYEPTKVFNCGSVWKRGLYDNISRTDAIHFCSSPHTEYIPSINKTTGKSVRAIMLEKR